MVKFYRTDDKLIHELDTLQGGTWIQMVNPSVAEGQMVADDLNVDIEDVLAALDEEESSRIELQDGYTLILVDIPSIETRHDKESYTTIPLGIILTDDEMKLSHAVVTSVDRDDLPDLGASHWVRTIREIKRLNPDTTVEVLIPDFQGRKELVAQVIDAQPEIISHNMETVRRISPLVRSAAKYETSLEVLRQIAESNTTTKSGIMVGLGETPEEVEELMDDLRRVDCHILTIGQYLQPTHKHYPVAAYITPEQFALYREKGLKKGFQQVESAPLVRSSYHAEKQIHFIQKRSKIGNI